MSAPFVSKRCLVTTKPDPKLKRWQEEDITSYSLYTHTSLTINTPLFGTAALFARGFKCIRATTSDNFRGRSSNIWTHDFLDSLQSDYQVNEYVGQVEKLKETVKDALNDGSVSTLTKMVLINDLQRLGIGYHFEKEIERELNILYMSTNGCNEGANLHPKALYFRLLRQNGYRVSQDLFNSFKDEEGNFRVELCEDVDGMLSLYEASFLGFEGENILLEARDFTIKHLKSLVKKDMNPSLAQEVSHALELPLHLRMPRLEARDYIDAYQRKETMDPILLQLAKLEFNALQATHQKELRDLSAWWKHLGLADKLGFARDRLVESFLWSLGLAPKPQHQRCREWITKVVYLIVMIDDVYDIYGSLEELQLFTSAVERWDVKAIEQLPEYMQLCFLALVNTINDIVYTQHKEQGFYILPYLNKVWADFCKAMLVEAKWGKMGYTPSLAEYLENAWISSSTTVVLVHAFFGSEKTMSNRVLKSLDDNSGLIYYSAMVCRLCNDLASSSGELERGEVASVVQCYMQEANTSEQVARDKIKSLISEIWMKLNVSILDSPFEQSFIDIVVDHARTSHTIYQRGDGMSVQDNESNMRVAKLLTKPTILTE